MDANYIIKLFESLKSVSGYALILIAITVLLTQLIKVKLLPSKYKSYTVLIPYVVSLVGVIVANFIAYGKIKNVDESIAQTFSIGSLSILIYNIYEVVFRDGYKRRLKKDPLLYDLFKAVRPQCKSDKSAEIVAVTLYDLRNSVDLAARILTALTVFMGDESASKISNYVCAVFDKYKIDNNLQD